MFPLLSFSRWALAPKWSSYGLIWQAYLVCLWKHALLWSPA